MVKIHQYWVYILCCKDGTFYTGVTNNLDRRIAEHQNGRNPTCYTFSRRPVILGYASEYRYILDAIRSEKQIKKWSQAKKLAAIHGGYGLLPGLSKKNFAIRAVSRSLLDTRSALLEVTQCKMELA